MAQRNNATTDKREGKSGCDGERTRGLKRIAEIARQISEEIANHPLAKDKEPQNHYPEAEADVLEDLAKKKVKLYHR